MRTDRLRSTDRLPSTCDVLVVGAGIIGAACAHYLTLAGLGVAVVDRAGLAAGTTGAGEGNILVSDKGPGPELDLALLSGQLWRELGEELGPGAELEPKGGVVVATQQPTLVALRAFAEDQRAAGVLAEPLDADEVSRMEPEIAPGMAGGMYYPQDQQVQPMMATALLLAGARRRGARVAGGVEVVSMTTDGHGPLAVRTSAGDVSTRVVVNAAGTWAGGLARRLGVELPVMPRRGVVLVTEPLPPLIRHKVYTADYVANVVSDQAGLETSTVVEGTRSGTVLVGASRERVGFDPRLDWRVASVLARQAVATFPVLGQVQVMRTYTGLRPYCPDHLPVIGPDRRVPGLFHACGHEGAGIGLAPATGHLLARSVLADPAAQRLEPFSPNRFAGDYPGPRTGYVS